LVQTARRQRGAGLPALQADDDTADVERTPLQALAHNLVADCPVIRN
jgi:hypothetical protein